MNAWWANVVGDNARNNIEAKFILTLPPFQSKPQTESHLCAIN